MRVKSVRAAASSVIDIASTPAIQSILGGEAATDEQAEIIRKGQEELDNLRKNGPVSQAEVDKILGKVCTALLPEPQEGGDAIRDRLGMYQRVDIGNNTWVLDKNQPQVQVLSYTDAINNLFKQANEWRNFYKTADKAVTARHSSYSWPINFYGSIATDIVCFVDFVSKVKPKGVWDVKNAKSWEISVDNNPCRITIYPGQRGGEKGRRICTDRLW